ncbi:UDP-N-acetylmuramoyl-L-alanyl-D-glutamate--2,6-diaminopimelate ligase [Tenuibacillus multivorans]|uniref:UDP-N-acetylmuramoyl-L-alanyl-D-glutamate--2,6-diaminopimelate ligase n=1 Tax=Tenuibacillus multivorans TaxID=237069 RepID=A0A1G9Y6N6_9BACI|nr:UDP-N-acetylmuramoyl-L-alanyl-D-glutamate--2,6-diaminopimelate ligase [Tenuibacillus multivorans]GEL75970.1 UDP-N-acetylmuramoyl-L-alanyl-D-glutamate--2,6-diaminopimelate ligase [Tenuibacillus multivorans]SDN04759.1 UDP-N-acetylmuramoyl-L-alanyl-D-glutamate--2,6-diaminopimelate ligase [Tenuibacillus multivorans]
MFLHELLEVLQVYQTANIPTRINITDIEMDSRKVEKGSLFVCIKGFQSDGHDFALEAEKRGAYAVVAEQHIKTNLPVIYVPSTVKALALLADYFYGHPSHDLNIIGITGTNGKTTLTYLLNSIFKAHGHRTAVIGTIDMTIINERYPLSNTTPDALFLHKHLKMMKEKQIQTVLMEVSSHALHLGRVFGIEFDTVIFTNLTQDHLDYHLNMNDYAYAKSLLFSQLGNNYKQRKTAIINVDDRYADVMMQATGFPVVPYGLSDEAFVRAKNIELGANDSFFEALTLHSKFQVHSKMTGKFNIYNMLAAIATSECYDIPSETVKNALEQSNGVPGRVESVKAGQSFAVIVDYAHTPDSLENVLESITEIKKCKIITVVGCGGDRDRTKRPKMADVAMKYSDYTFFTSDNPRTEDPKAILKDMTGHLSGDRFRVITDRKEAIKQAIWSAEKDDIILIAGKGHETYQDINGQRHHFDDREIAKAYIEDRLKE